MSSLLALGIGACGSSGTSTTTATQANSAAPTKSGTTTAHTGTTTSTAKAATPKSVSPRALALRSCLQRNGVKLPNNGGARGLFLGGGLPKGVSVNQLRAAMRKCLGATGALARAGRPGFLRAKSPRFTQALSTFAACMRKNGVNVPAPNTSGRGPIFSTKGLNTASPRFKAASAKCRPALTAGFRGPRAAGVQPGG